MRISDWSSDVCSSDLGLAAASGDARFAWDSYRRFIQMYSDVVLGVDHYLFEEALEIRKEDKGLLLDTELAAEDWQALVGVYKKKVEEEIGRASCRERVCQYV